jgi:MATE family multidrug resistance protein
LRDPYSHRSIWRIAAPMILSNVSPPLLGVVDTAVMGHLESPHYIGAVAVGAVVFSFLYTAFNFLRMGTTGVAAQAHGAGDATGVRLALLQSLLIAIGIAVLLIILQRPLGTLAMGLVAPGADVGQAAWDYFNVRIWSAPATLATFALMGWFIGLGNARAPLLIVLVVNLLNIVLDIVFVPILGMKSEGVALATVIAEYAGVSIALWLARAHLHGGTGIDVRLVFDATRLRRLVAVNTHLFVRTLALMFAFAFLTAMGARQGELVLAANAILINLQYVMAYALDGFANAAEALVGRAIGARDREGLRLAVRRSMQWCAGAALLIAAVYAITGPAIVDLLTTLESVRVTTDEYLPWMVAAPLICAWCYLYDGVYVGATRSREMRDTMLLSLALFLLAWWLLRPLGNHGLWLAFMLFNAARGISQHLWFNRLEASGRLIPASAPA